jgi:hypothetical protein
VSKGDAATPIAENPFPEFELSDSKPLVFSSGVGAVTGAENSSSESKKPLVFFSPGGGDVTGAENSSSES